MQGQQGLVGGDDMLAFFNGLKHKTLGRFVATHQFDHHRDFRVVEDGVDIRGQAAFVYSHAALRYDIEIGDPFQDNTSSHFAADDIRIFLKQFDYSGANVTESYQSNFYIVHFKSSKKII